MVKFTLSLLLVFIFQFGISQTTYAVKSQLKKSVSEFESAIQSKNAEKFKKLFLSDEVSFVGVMSGETENSMRENFPGFDGTSVSDCGKFISTIVDSEKKYSIKIYDINTDTHGPVASVDFNYAFYAGKNMKQWGREKWNLVKSKKKWLITNVIYSVHFPNVEQCPFDETPKYKKESEDEIAEPYEPNIVVKPPGKTKKKKKYQPQTQDNDDDIYDDDIGEDEEDEKEEEEEVKPEKVTKTLTVMVNGRLKAPLYAGIENKVKIKYKDLPNSKISIHSSAPNVEYHKKESGIFSIKPVSDMDDFSIHIRAGNRTLNYTFKVENMPNPRPLMSKRYTGPVNAKEFQGHMGILASTKDFPFRAKCIITGFTVTRIPKKGKQESIKNKGGRFQNQTQVLVKKAKRGDKYNFEKIGCQCPGDGKLRRLENLNFTIK